MNIQTNHPLRTLLTQAKLAEGLPNHLVTVHRLRTERRKVQVWAGSSENLLRAEIDEYVEQHLRGNWTHPDPIQFRACYVCVHSVLMDDARHCMSPETTMSKGLTLCSAARSSEGACGPGAKFLKFPGEKR